MNAFVSGGSSAQFPGLRPRDGSNGRTSEKRALSTSAQLTGARASHCTFDYKKHEGFKKVDMKVGHELSWKGDFGCSAVAQLLRPCWWISDIIFGGDVDVVPLPSLSPEWFSALANGILKGGSAPPEALGQKGILPASVKSWVAQPLLISSRPDCILVYRISKLDLEMLLAELLCDNIHLQFTTSWMSAPQSDVNQIGLDGDEGGSVGASGNDGENYGNNGPRDGGGHFGQNKEDPNDDENTSDDGDETEDDSDDSSSSESSCQYNINDMDSWDICCPFVQ